MNQAKPLQASEAKAITSHNELIINTCAYMDREIKEQARAGGCFMTFYMDKFAIPIDPRHAPIIQKNFEERGFKVEDGDRRTYLTIHWVY